MGILCLAFVYHILDVKEKIMYGFIIYRKLKPWYDLTVSLILTAQAKISSEGKSQTIHILHSSG